MVDRDIKLDEQQWKKEYDRLREIIGSWRRKAQEKKSRRKECLREGFSAYDNQHYKVYIVDDIPGDLSIRDVLQELKKGFLQDVKPYRFSKCDYSTKYDAWLVEIAHRLDGVDMFNDFD